MNRIAAALGICVFSLSAGCSDRILSSTKEQEQAAAAPPAGLIVSNSFTDARATVNADASTVETSTASLTYVSAMPGTFDRGVSITIRNSSGRGAVITVPIVLGGFDPVGVAAEDGDKILLTVQYTNGDVTSFVVDVPARKRPVIVRTSPPKGATDVPVNVRVTLIFSEPIDASSLTPSTLQMTHNGAVVSGSVQGGSNALSFDFVPASPLSSGTTYTFVVDESLRDLDGESLTTAFSTFFTTVGTSATKNPVANITISAPLGSYVVGSTALLQATLTDLSGTKVTGRLISWSSSNAQVATISPNGLLTAIAPGSSTIAASSEGRMAQVVVNVVEGSATQGQLLFAHWPGRNIFQVAIDGSGLRQLTFSGMDSRPVYSPDGERIAFARGTWQADIFVMNADGSDVTRLTTNRNFHSAAWSPDGRTLAVSNEGVYEADIHLISATELTSQPVHLVKDARSPVWSPDGQQIAFVRTSGDDGYHQVVVINRDGTGEREVTVVDPGGIFGLSWSPGGSQLSFGKCLLGDCEVYVVNADGSALRAITDVGGAAWAAWSPDGKWIATELHDWNSRSLVTTLAYLPATGGSPIVIAANGSNPSWKPMTSAPVRK